MSVHAAPKSPFRVSVRDLPASKHLEVGPEYVASVLAGMPLREAVKEVEAGAGALDLELYGEGENVHAHGRMRGHVTVACSRCVGPARIDIDESLRLTFMPAAQVEEQEAASAEAASEGEGVEIPDSELDLFPYDGETIDLEPVIREQLVLAVPYAPLCKEACEGLCPQCGADKNVERCSCEKPVDPRFAALKGLKLPS